MGTEILRPHDCLASQSPSLFSRRNPNRRPKRRLVTASAVITPVMGQVTILKRGEPLDSHRRSILDADPTVAPKPIRVADLRPDDVYAGSAFVMSPSPRKLPLPRFAAAMSDSTAATQDLRRLLRLE